IELPPLRERPGDLDVLIEHLLTEFAQTYRVAPKRLSPEARERLHRHDWPGNVRELQNVIERAFAISSAETIELRDVAPALQSPNGLARMSASAPSTAAPEPAAAPA